MILTPRQFNNWAENHLVGRYVDGLGIEIHPEKPLGVLVDTSIWKCQRAKVIADQIGCPLILTILGFNWRILRERFLKEKADVEDDYKNPDFAVQIAEQLKDYADIVVVLNPNLMDILEDVNLSFLDRIEDVERRVIAKACFVTTYIFRSHQRNRIRRRLMFAMDGVLPLETCKALEGELTNHREIRVFKNMYRDEYGLVKCPMNKKGINRIQDSLPGAMQELPIMHEEAERWATTGTAYFQYFNVAKTLVYDGELLRAGDKLVEIIFEPNDSSHGKIHLKDVIYIEG